jgi:hypothetical protein
MKVLFMTLLMLLSTRKCLAVVEMTKLCRLECALTSMLEVYTTHARSAFVLTGQSLFGCAMQGTMAGNATASIWMLLLSNWHCNQGSGGDPLFSGGRAQGLEGP